MESRRTALVVTVLVVVSVLITLTTSVPAQGIGSGLFGRGFESSRAVIKNGERKPLVEGTRIRVDFYHKDDHDHDTLGWRSGCNRFGARVEITPKHLDVGQIAGTEVACDKPLARQDRWVARFFGSAPNWARNGRKLRLTRDDDVIRLWRSTG